MSKQLSLFPEDNYVPFVSEVEQFNKLMNKPNNYEPTIHGKKDWQFVIDFVKEGRFLQAEYARNKKLIFNEISVFANVFHVEVRLVESATQEIGISKILFDPKLSNIAPENVKMIFPY